MKREKTYLHLRGSGQRGRLLLLGEELGKHQRSGLLLESKLLLEGELLEGELLEGKLLLEGELLEGELLLLGELLLEGEILEGEMLLGQLLLQRRREHLHGVLLLLGEL
jgi:hypothetical protein